MSSKKFTQVLTIAALTAALGACSGSESPAAQPSATTSTAATTPEPDVTTPTADAAAQEALPLLTQQQGAAASSLAPAVGADSPDLAVLASSPDEISTTISFWAWDGTAFQPVGGLTADEPLLASREGGAAEWHHLTGGRYPDAVVYLQGGTMAPVQAVIARHEEDGSWRFVPLEGQHGEGIAVEDDVYADNPLFDEGRTFVTRAQAGGQVAVTYWRYEGLDGKNWFTRTSEPDPSATGR